jgi:hypothetical protein
MILHVLPGDAIVKTFQLANIEGDIAVCREAFVDGDLVGEALPQFWTNRAKHYSGDTVDAEADYHHRIVREFAKLTAVRSDSVINLWFEYELFCHVNMWFCLSLLAKSTADIFRVEPVTLPENEIWDGFGNMSETDLRECYAARVQFSPADVQLGADLWDAYRLRDHRQLDRLSKLESPAFPKLREVCLAAIEKEIRPKLVVNEIIQSGETKFENVFREFKARAGVYGYGDAQVRTIWQELVV